MDVWAAASASGFGAAALAVVLADGSEGSDMIGRTAAIKGV